MFSTVLDEAGRVGRMRNEAPLAVYRFGWGRLFRLYRDHLDVNGTHYALNDLTYVRLILHHVMGISSARLELYFGKKKLVLPGIAEVEDIQKTVAYLMYAGGMVAPTQLLPGERTHYITDATLCGERLGGSTRSAYPVLDQGMLILTSRRVIYIGRTSQVTLDYASLLHVSRLHSAVALQADDRQKRVVFAMRWPLTCATYLESMLRQLQADTATWALGERIGCSDDRHVDGVMEPRLW